MVKYVSLPLEKLPPEFNTYSVHISGGNSSYAGATPDVLGRNIHMNGFKRVEGTQNQYGHLRVMVNTGYTECGRPELKSKTTTTKDKEGVEKKTTTYWYEMPCQSTTSHRIMDPEGKVLSSGSKFHSNTPKTSDASASSALSKQYDSLINGLRSGFARDVAASAVSSAHYDLLRKFDFAHVTEDPQIYYVKKHPAEDEFEANMEKTKAVFEGLKADSPASEGMKQMAGIIEFWKKHGEKDPAGDKDLLDVYVGCNSNLATVYFYLDEFDEAKKYAQRVLKADPKDKRTEKFLEFMAEIKGKMDFHGIHTMHYSRDLTNAIPPTKVKEIEEEKEQLQEENNSLTGVIVVDGDSIRGFFARDKEATEFMFGPNGNTKFITEASAKIEEFDLTTAKVQGFTIGGRKFTKLNFSPSAKGKTEPALHIMEELYQSDKIKLFKYYPVSGVLSNEQHEFAFQKASEPVPVSLLDTRFLLWNKGLGEYFSDCADLKAMSVEGGFKMVEEDLLKVARIYNEVCE